MTEIISEQKDQRDPRPIGRFLLGFEISTETRDPFTYARDYSRLPGNFEKHKHKSIKIEDTNELTLDGRNVELEFMIDRFGYVWKITIAAEARTSAQLATNYMTHGGEQYELHCSVLKNAGHYREYNSQGGIVRTRQLDSTEELGALQDIVERLLPQ